MIGMRTILEVADNSGARRLSCIAPRGGDLGLRAGLGDVITAAVKEAAPDGSVKKGDVCDAVVVRTKQSIRRADGSYLRFDRNAIVIIDQTQTRRRAVKMGTRVILTLKRDEAVCIHNETIRHPNAGFGPEKHV